MLKNFLGTIFVGIALFAMVNVSADRNFNSYHLSYLLKKEWNYFNASLRKKAPKKRTTQWSAHFTPAIPAVWPPKDKPETVYYGYPGGVDKQKLKHQEYRGVPWVKLTVKPDKTMTKKMLSKTLVKIEHQATWLKRYKGYQQIFESNANAPSLVANLTRKGLFNRSDVKKIRAYYCHWKNTQVISNSIKQKHPGFFSWLNCK